MASIKIANLQPAGADLFNDSESYLAELANEELNIVGGRWIFPTITSPITNTIISPITNTITTSDIAK